MHVSLDNLLITLRKSSLGDLYLITNQEHKAFDLKNSKREEERKGQRELGRGEEGVPPVFLWLAEMQIWGEMTFWGSVLVKKFLEK